MRVRVAGLLVAGLAVTLVLGACGDGDEERLSQAQFVAEGNRICAQTRQVVDQAAETAFPNRGNVPTAEEIQRFADDTLVPQLKRELDELKDLNPPEDEEEDVKEIIEAGEQGADQTSTRAVLLQNKARSPLNRYAELAGEYGLETCGRLSDRTQNLLAGID
jgi:hypothetical protein